MSNAQGSHRAARGSGGAGRKGKPTGIYPTGIYPSRYPDGCLPLCPEAHPPPQAAAYPPPQTYTPTVPGYVSGYADTIGALAVPQGRAGGARPPGRRRAGRPDGLRRLLPQVLVVAFLAGGTSAFVVSDKTVQLSVDGVPRSLYTFAGTVDELLDDERVSLGAHDVVAPGHRAALADGDAITVRHGRPLVLTLDGQRRQIWTTARTVDGALRALGVRTEGACLSVPRYAAISRHGLALDVRTERTVTFIADGRERTLRTNTATVREALEEAGIDLHGQDTTSVPADTFPRDRQTITVLRITGARAVRLAGTRRQRTPKRHRPASRRTGRSGLRTAGGESVATLRP